MFFITKILPAIAFFAIFICLSECQSGINVYRNDDDSFSTERNRDLMVCMDIYPQEKIDMKEILGKWYGNEIIIHTQDVPGEYKYDSCVIIQISNYTDQMQNNYYNDYRRTSSVLHQYELTRQQQQQQQRKFRQNQEQSTQQQGQHQNQNFDFSMRRQLPQYLRLLWSERDDTLEYIFNYTTESPGRWANVGEQQGSFVTLNHYTQFSGTVQVAKAVNDHLVLTFCGNNLKSSIYTVVLSRDPHGLSRGELYNIRSLLSNRHLSVDTIRKVCSSAAAALKGTIAIVLMLIVVAVH